MRSRRALTPMIRVDQLREKPNAATPRITARLYPPTLFTTTPMVGTRVAMSQNLNAVPGHRHPRARRGAYLEAMRILITGAGGFLGSHLSDLLLEQGHEVVGRRQLPHRPARERGPPRRPRRLRAARGRRDRAAAAGRRRRADRPHLPPGQPRLARGVLQAPGRHAQGQQRGHLANARAGAGEEGPASSWPARASATATHSSTRSPKATGATSTRSACAACTTRPSALPRPARWPTAASAAPTRG